MKTRILSLLLAVVMILGMLPMGVMATEAATTEPTYTIDFKQFAKDAATQDWWNTLYAAADANTKWVGFYTGKYEWTDETWAAYESMTEYQKAEYGWYLDETTTNLENPKDNKGNPGIKGLYINSADNITWGVSLYSGQLNKAGADYDIILNVDKAGVYAMDMTAFYESTGGACNIPATTGGASGSGYLDILVNDKLVLDDHKLLGTAADGNANATLTTNVAVVYLHKGENTITARPAKDLDGIESSARRHINLTSFTFTEAECPHEDVTGYICDLCGDIVTADGVYVIDFKQMAKKAAEQPWWDELMTDCLTLTAGEATGEPAA